MSVTTMKAPNTRRPFLIAAAIVVVLGVGLWFSGIWSGMGAQLVHEPVSQLLGAAARADVTIAMGVGQLRIGALDQPNNLIAGDISYSDRSSVDRSFALRGDTASFTLREQHSQANSLIKHSDDAAIWNLRLNPATPMRLTIETSVGASTIDLRQIHVTELDLKTGIGTTTLTLPRQGHVQVHISGGVGNTTIVIPAGVAVRLAIDAGVGSIKFPDAYQQQGDAYVSPDYETAANRIDLTASSGIGNITIKQISE
jgi:Cell wall-active antibiotics response 4TMS YvqF